MKNKFCENNKCIFNSIEVKNNNDIIKSNVDGKIIKRDFNIIKLDGKIIGEIWLCDNCMGVLQLLDDLISFSKIGGIIN